MIESKSSTTNNYHTASLYKIFASMINFITHATGGNANICRTHIKMDLVYTNAHFTPPEKSFMLWTGPGKQAITVAIIRYVDTS